MARTAGLLLAAGAGRRFGGPKALAVLADGTGFLVHAVRALREGGCAPVVVVLGSAAEQARLLVTDADAEVVVNGDWATGMGSSLRQGLTALPTDVDAAVVLLVDTPGIGPAAVARLATFADPVAIAVATYAGRRGHPVLLGRRHWPEVCRLAVGDTGARPFLRAHGSAVVEVPCDDVADPTDIDTAGDLPPGRLSTGP
ncbi:MAG: nucleotidyltransferase family protein [Geodermatophilaceae bacterium]|nr:nucleotidyltransferase family protein [Geodermatophilaceae bacterium]